MSVIGRKWVTKKVLHDYSAVIAVSVSLLLILLVLILSRYGSLYSIKDIANINPLITTSTSELVAVDVNGVIKIAKDDDTKVSETPKKSSDVSSDKSLNRVSGGNTGDNPTPTATVGGGGGAGAGVGTGTNTNAGGGAGTGTNTNAGGTTTNTPPSAWVVSFTRNPTEDKRGTGLGAQCTWDYSFSVTVGMTAMSTVDYTIFAGLHSVTDKALPLTPSKKSVRVAAEKNTTITGVKVQLASPGNPSKTLENFTHKC